jgi:hypothetical protein
MCLQRETALKNLPHWSSAENLQIHFIRCRPMMTSFGHSKPLSQSQIIPSFVIPLSHLSFLCSVCVPVCRSIHKTSSFKKIFVIYFAKIHKNNNTSHRYVQVTKTRLQRIKSVHPVVDSNPRYSVPLIPQSTYIMPSVLA